jgi:heme a synthase
MRRPTLSPSSYRRITGVALAALAFIVVTGAAVRLTGSGLGCPDWPTCQSERVVAPLEYHAMVEFVNRTITGIVSVAVMLAVLGALVRVPRRRDLTWLSLGLVGGVLAQIVLGGLVVLFHLAPGLVMLHFSVSMVLIWNAVVLHHRAGLPDSSHEHGSDPSLVNGSRLLVAAAGLTIFLGTVVTGSGPHTGDHEGEFIERLPFAVREATRFHAASALILIGIALWMAWRARPRTELASERATTMLAALLAQAGVGYVQYFTGVPALLVGVHVAGAVAVWISVLRFALVAPWTAPPPDPSSQPIDAAREPVAP